MRHHRAAIIAPPARVMSEIANGNEPEGRSHLDKPHRFGLRVFVAFPARPTDEFRAISEMNLTKERGNGLGALAIVTLLIFSVFQR